MRKRKWLTLASVLFTTCSLAACAPPAKTPSERCYRQARGSRIGRSMHPDPYLDQMELARCQQMESEERADERTDRIERAIRGEPRAEQPPAE